jgi:hypothetical protein
MNKKEQLDQKMAQLKKWRKDLDKIKLNNIKKQYGKKAK